MGTFSSKGVRFDPDKQIPSLRGKVIVVTRGNSGLGKQSILELAKHSPEDIWLGTRSNTKAQQAIDDIKAQVPNAPPIKILQMNLTFFFGSIREAVKSFHQQSQHLDILLLNAGIMSFHEVLTKDGYEIQFGTNYMGHALLSKLLLPAMLKTSEQRRSDIRVVVLASSSHQYASRDQGITFDTLKTKAQEIGTIMRYGQNKLVNILFAQQFARLYPQIKVPVLNPGLVNTNLANTMSNNSFIMRIAWMITAASIGVDVKTGALNQLWASTANVKSGEYYGKVGLGKRWTNNPSLAQKLWN